MMSLSSTTELEVDTSSGRLVGATWVPSPNFDARPPGVVTELIVVHGISLPPGEFGGPWIQYLFCNALDPGAHPYFATIAALRVSAHLLIRRDGRILQFVRFDDRAWHAGQSSWRGRERCNDFSIGIELEGVDDLPYEPAQYGALGAACGALLRAYPTLDADAIAGHSDIAPGRKTDPGPGFDWALFRATLAQARGR